MDDPNDFYPSLDRELHSLISQFGKSQPLPNHKVMDWARLFNEWSKSAALYCGPWSRTNLKGSQGLIRELGERYAGRIGFFRLKKALDEASRNLTKEIQNKTRPDSRTADQNGDPVQGTNPQKEELNPGWAGDFLEDPVTSST